MEQLNPTAYVILGFVRNEPRSGYEIKALVDNSTRFFWAASYGQIYPELKRLSEAGLIVGSDSPTGGRKRTVYEITADGEEELRAWLRQEPRDLRDARRRAAEALLRRRAATGGGGGDPARDASPAPRRPRAAAGHGRDERRNRGPLPDDGPAREAWSSRSGLPIGASGWRRSSSTPLPRKGAVDVRFPGPARGRQARNGSALLALVFFLAGGGGRRRGRRPARPLRRRRPGDRDGAGDGPAGGSRAADPGGDRRGRGRAGGEAGDPGAGRGAGAAGPRAPRRRLGDRLLRHPLARLRLRRRPVDLLRGGAEGDRRQALAGRRRRDRRRTERPSPASSSAAPRSPRSRSTSRSRKT